MTPPDRGRWPPYLMLAAVVVLLIYGLTQQGESRALDNAIAAESSSGTMVSWLKLSGIC